MKAIKTPFLFFFLSGLTCAIFYYFYQHQAQTYDWTRIKAHIDSTEVRTINNSEYLLVYYHYEFGGAVYTGSGQASDLNGDELLFSKSDNRANAAYEKFLGRDSLDVYYNPNKPEVSVSYPDANIGLMIGAVISGLMALLGLIGLVTALRKTI